MESLERRELLTVGPVNAVVDVQGTDGDDTFAFAPGDEPGVWLVTLNGAESEYRAPSILVRFHGGMGNDSAKLLGDDMPDVVTLLPGGGTLSNGAYSVEIEGFEKVFADAGRGNNEAILYDGVGDDTLEANPNSATLTGADFENTVVSSPLMYIYGEAGGKDTAFLHADPDGSDRFVSGPGWAKFLGDSYGVRTFGFDWVHAYASEGGGDVALIHDTPGRADKVVSTPDVTKLNGKGGARRLFGFNEIRVESTLGDRDVVKIYGDPARPEELTTEGANVKLAGSGWSIQASDFFESRIYGGAEGGDVAVLAGVPSLLDRCLLYPAYAKMAGEDYRVRAYSFERTTARGEPGMDESATLYGAPGQEDSLSAGADSARLSGAGFDCRAEDFREVFAFATSGDGDKARLFSDADTPEYFEADPKVGILRSADWHVQVRHFDQVNAYAAPGSSDTAVMYASDSTVNQFEGTPQLGALRGNGFLRQAFGFRYVHAYADPGLQHVATLSDSGQDDVLVATSEYAELTGPGYMTRVVSFHDVRARASAGGNDEAVLYDTDGMDYLEADTAFVRMTHAGVPRDFAVEATQFDTVRIHSSNDHDIVDVVPGSVQWLDEESTGSSASGQALGGSPGVGPGVGPIVGPITDEAEAPNVVFLAVDDLNDWVGALGGYAAVQTPNLDRLAARGVTFSKAYCPAPFCNPSRSAVMTGYYPATSGVYKNTDDWRVALPDALTLPELFKANGYDTVGGGKVLHWNDRALWDEYYPQVSDPVPTAEVLQSEDNSTGVLSWGRLDVPDQEMNDYRITSWAADYLHRQHDDPFFLACGVFRPHVPMNVPDAYFDMYPLEQIVLPEVLPDDLDDVPAIVRSTLEDDNLNTDLLEAGNREKVVQAYLASVSFADAQIGRVLDALEASEYANNTIVALWSDHGMHFGEKNHWKKGTLWEEATRVPLIVSAPGVGEPGSVVDYPVDLVNLYPTLADLCDLPVEDSLDGISLRPLLEDPDTQWDRPALMNHRDHNAVRYQDWRYIRYADGSEELYDHRTDPNEWTNLASDPALQPIKTQLAAMLPEKMAAETPNRAPANLHWDAVAGQPAPEPVVLGDRVLYSRFDSAAGRELWTTNGNATSMVRDIHPGPGSSTPTAFAICEGIVYFHADDGQHGGELWRTDGTDAGTWLVRDIRPGSESSAIDGLVQAGGLLFFQADDGRHGPELWRSDGTEDGTVMLRDVVAGTAGSYPMELTAVGSRIFFQARDGEAGTELWTSDGTGEGTRLVADIRPGPGSSIPCELTATPEGIYFRATDGLHGLELWYADGTAENTYLVDDLLPGPGGSAPAQLAFDGARMYFIAAGLEGRGLWAYEAGRPPRFLSPSINQAAVASGFDQLTPAASLLYFQASDAVHGTELWGTDGTADGTRMVRDLWFGGVSSLPARFTPTEDGLIFVADDGVCGRELWFTQGSSAGTAIVTDLFPGQFASDPTQLVLLGDVLLTFATDGNSGYRLWRIEEGVAQPVDG
ncbi:MAG: ELWxxDGT repeat protein [Thermoguttaceae bacterium]